MPPHASSHSLLRPLSPPFPDARPAPPGRPPRSFPLAACLLLALLLGASASRGDVPADDLLSLGLARLDAEAWADAEAIFERLTSEEPGSAEAHYYLGLAAAGADRPMRAALAFARALALDPELPWVETNLGIALFRAGDLEDAEAHLLQALFETPDDATLLIYLGRIDLERGRPGPAIELFERAAELEPRNAALPWLHVARTERARGDLPAALDALDRARTAPGPAAARERAEALRAELGEGIASPSTLHVWQLEATAGLEYDDNLSEDRLGASSSQADVAGSFELFLAHSISTAAGTAASITYDFQQNIHRDLEHFDLQSHAPGFEFETDWRFARPRARYTYTHESLGAEAFLDTHEVDLSLERSFTAVWSASLGGEWELLDFAGFQGTGGERLALAFDQRVDLLEGRLALLLGWRPEWYAADASALDYHGHDVRADISVALFGNATLGRSLFVDLLYEYEYRDFPEFAHRTDRHDLQSTLSLPLARHFYAEFEYRHIRVDSDLERARYHENLFTLRLRFSL